MAARKLLITQRKWRSLRDYSALRASPLRGRRRRTDGVQLGLAAELSNSLAGWRPHEFSYQVGKNWIENTGDAPAFSIQMALPTRFELVFQP